MRSHLDRLLHNVDAQNKHRICDLHAWSDEFISMTERRCSCTFKQTWRKFELQLTFDGFKAKCGLFDGFTIIFIDFKNAKIQVSIWFKTLNHWTNDLPASQMLQFNYRKTQPFIGIWSSQSSRKHFDENVKEKSIKLINHFMWVYKMKRPRIAGLSQSMAVALCLAFDTYLHQKKYFKAKIVIMPLWCFTNEIYTHAQQIKSKSKTRVCNLKSTCTRWIWKKSWGVLDNGNGAKRHTKLLH